MDSLFNSVEKFFLEHGANRTYWLALSGGLDSTVLLHLFLNLRSLYSVRFRVIHVHHGLSSNADAWSEHCASVCKSMQVDFIQKNIQAKSVVGESPEEIARQRRYQVFAELVEPNDILLTAHQQDDQAETVLLQLLRGAGPKGLAAMSAFKPFYRGFHARPLLSFSRQVLQNYADENHLSWIDDESNQNLNFTRNFIRHDVITLLKSRWPTVTTTLARVAEHCAEAQALLDDAAQTDLEDCRDTENTLSVKKILELSLAKQRQVIRVWLSQLNIPIPSTIKMQHILQDVLHAAADKLPHVTWGNIELRRYRDRLFVMPRLLPHDANQEFIWDLKQRFTLPDSRELRAVSVEGKGMRADIHQVSLRFRHGGEVMRIPGREHHHSLKNLFQEWGVPPWQRDRIPLLYVNDELAAVVGYAVAERFAASKGEKGWEVSYV